MKLIEETQYCLEYKDYNNITDYMYVIASSFEEAIEIFNQKSTTRDTLKSIKKICTVLRKSTKTVSINV